MSLASYEDVDYDDLRDAGKWDEYCSLIGVHEAAWSLTKNLPVTFEWARELARLLEKTSTCHSSIEDPLKIAERWQLPGEDAQVAKWETENNNLGYLGFFQGVRMHLGRLFLAKKNAPAAQDRLLESDDIALRCAAYGHGACLTAELVKSAYERDRLFAVNYIVYNE